MCRILHHQSFSVWKRIPFLFNLSSDGQLRNGALKVLHGETQRVIKLRRSQMDAEGWASSSSDGGDKDANEIGGTKRRVAFLDSLLMAQRETTGQLTDANIQEEVDTFMFEGHDTTSSALGFAVYLLSQHAAVQQRAYDEAVQCVGHESESMTYLEAVIKETIRIYPPVPFFSRKAVEPFTVGTFYIRFIFVKYFK